MNRYRYEFTNTLKILMIVALLLCVGGFGMNVYTFITQGIDGAYSAFRYILIVLATIGGFIVILSMLISSYYEVNEQELVTAFGVIKSRYKISDIAKLSLNPATNKLSVTFQNGSFMLFSVNEQWHESLINALREKNNKIDIEYLGNTNA